MLIIGGVIMACITNVVVLRRTVHMDDLGPLPFIMMLMCYDGGFLIYGIYYAAIQHVAGVWLLPVSASLALVGLVYSDKRLGAFTMLASMLVFTGTLLAGTLQR